MSTYVLMKILESAPNRYDKGIQILTFGRLNKYYDDLISHIKKGQKVLDIGCGTGALTLKAAQIGAKVKGIDDNSQMLEIAQKRVAAANLAQNIQLSEMGVGELESEESKSYDAVMSGLCFSEISDDEIVYTLNEVERILKPGGILLIADEVSPKNILKKIINLVIRVPLVIITYLITQTTTNAVKNLLEKIQESGMIIESVKLNKLESFIELVAKTPKGKVK